mmetsp:Transcript_20252/g.34586  ORF Transcript_20252/g.34586 Transcript_20252/m.34586 type:complete len:222 (-) Transcript_20252:867-1532(-)
MNTLSTRQNLLTTNHEIIRICDFFIVGVEHSVKWTSGSREFIQTIKVGAKFFFDQLTQSTFIDSRQIFKWTLFDTSIIQHFHTFRERHQRRWKFHFKRGDRVLLRDESNVVFVFFLQTSEDRFKHVVHHVQHLVIVFVERHFQIHANEFSHVARCVAVLGTKHRSDFKDAIHIGTDAHLLVKLRRLCKIGMSTKITNVKHIGTAFRFESNHFWCVNFIETL